MSNASLITSISGNLKSADERTTDAFASRRMVLLAPVRTANAGRGRTITTILAATPLAADDAASAARSFIAGAVDLLDIDRLIAWITYRQLTILPIPTVKYLNLAEAVKSLTDVGVVTTLPGILKNYLDDAEISALLNSFAESVTQLGATFGVSVSGLTGENLFTHADGNEQEEFLIRTVLSRAFRLSTALKGSDLVGDISYFAGVAIERQFVTQDILTTSDPNGLSELDLSAALVSKITYLHREVSTIVSTLLSAAELQASAQNGGIPNFVLQTLETMVSRQLRDDQKTMLPGIESVVLIATDDNAGGIITFPVYANIGVPPKTEKVAAEPSDAAPTDEPTQAPA